MTKQNNNFWSGAKEKDFEKLQTWFTEGAVLNADDGVDLLYILMELNKVLPKYLIKDYLPTEKENCLEELTKYGNPYGSSKPVYGKVGTQGTRENRGQQEKHPCHVSDTLEKYDKKLNLFFDHDHNIEELTLSVLNQLLPSTNNYKKRSDKEKHNKQMRSDKKKHIEQMRKLFTVAIRCRIDVRDVFDALNDSSSVDKVCEVANREKWARKLDEASIHYINLRGSCHVKDTLKRHANYLSSTVKCPKLSPEELSAIKKVKYHPDIKGCHLATSKNEDARKVLQALKEKCGVWYCSPKKWEIHLARAQAWNWQDARNELKEAKKGIEKVLDEMAKVNK